MPFPDMVPAFESGAVDAAILSEPFPTLAEEKGVALRPLPKAAGAKAGPDHRDLLEPRLGLRATPSWPTP